MRGGIGKTGGIRKNSLVATLAGALAATALIGVAGTGSAEAVDRVGGADSRKGKPSVLCVNKWTHGIVVRKRKCKKGERRYRGLSGPAGPAGAAGANGAEGPAGAVGPQGPAAGYGFTYKLGDVGPGGGNIFFVDYYDQFPGFTYLEAAPAVNHPANQEWCSNTNVTVMAVGGWADTAVGRGQANTTAMMSPHGPCFSGAANTADAYVSPNGTSDWFLPSLGEMMLMYTNLRQAGVGAFAPFPYWSSNQYESPTQAWAQDFETGAQARWVETESLFVRPARAFS